MKTVIRIFLVCAIFFVLLWIMSMGFTIGRNAAPPEVIVEKEYVPIYYLDTAKIEAYEKQLREQSIQIDGLKYEVAIRDKRIVELEAIQAYLELILELTKRTGGLQPFRTWDELTTWLAENPVSEREYSSPDYVCTDFAYDLFFDALAEGRLMGVERISNERHQQNFTLVGRHIVIIDPTTDGITSDEDWVYRGWHEWLGK